jgi:CHAT domain-containing protein
MARCRTLTWCLTEPLTFLPIHAAGLYDTKDQPKIFDYVVSSYTPTLTALLRAKRHVERSQTTHLLAISQPQTPDQIPLPGSIREIDVVQALQSQTDRFRVTRLDDRGATRSAVLKHMKGCSWIHLACHGVQNSANPMDSAFSLADGPLTLREIMKQSFPHAELAVLSACEAAKGDSELPEEAIHLAAGMMMAGYGSVVATVWAIADKDGPIVAGKFYKYLIEEADGDGRRAAYALHDAVTHLRDVIGERSFARWAPFIHLGICLPPSSSIQTIP